MTYPRFCIMLLLPALLAGCQQACATPAGLFVPDTCGFIGVVTMEEELHGPLKQERGEVIAADKDYLIIRSDDGEERVYPVKDCLVFVNGRPGENTALKPVARGFNFYACLYFLPGRKLHLIAGWYLGGEVKILGIEEAGEGKCIVTVSGLENQIKEKVVWYLLEDSARLVPGTAGYLLLAPDGRVRKFSPLE